MSATNRGAIRRLQDDYQTPIECIDPLLERINWPATPLTFFEPCRGTGNIYDRIPLPNKNWCELNPIHTNLYDPPQAPRDYLTHRCPEVDLIITNPPFSHAKEFLEKSLTHGGTVIYLLRLNFWGSQARAPWWRSLPEPTHQLVLSKRPSFTGAGTDATEYAWFVWDRDGLLKPGRRLDVLTPIE